MGCNNDDADYRISRHPTLKHDGFKCCACDQQVPAGEIAHEWWEGADYDDAEEDEEREDTLHGTQCSRCYLIWRKLQDEHDEANTEHFVDIELNCGMSWDEFFDGEMPEEILALAFESHTTTRNQDGQTEER